MRLRLLLVAVCLPAMPCFADDARLKPALIGSSAEVREFIKNDVSFLRDLLDTPKVEKKHIKLAKVLAIVIGTNADALGTNEGRAIRELAAKVLESLNQDNIAAAKQAAADMADAKKPAGASHQDLTSFLFDNDPAVKDWDRDLAMQLFKSGRAGGMNFEFRIKQWAAAPPARNDVPKLVELVQKTAVIANVLEQMKPPRAAPPAPWKQLAEQLKSASADVLKVDRTDMKALQTAMNRIDRACTTCHEKYK